MKPVRFTIFLFLSLLLVAGTIQAQDSDQDTTNLQSLFSFRISATPLMTNMSSNQYKFEEKSGLGYGLGGDIIYNFYKKNKLSLNTSFGFAVLKYNCQRNADYTNSLLTTDIDNESVLLTEKAANLVEKQSMLFLNIPLKFGAEYSLSRKLSAYANIGLAYGFNLNAKYNSTALLTRTGYYSQYNVLLYNIDVSGSPYYYPTNKAVSGSGSINRRNNLSTEGAVGMLYRLSPQLSFFAGTKIFYGFENIKASQQTMILASDDYSLNTLANRNDVLRTSALGLEVGVQFNLNKKVKVLVHKEDENKLSDIKATSSIRSTKENSLVVAKVSKINEDNKTHSQSNDLDVSKISTTLNNQNNAQVQPPKEETVSEIQTTKYAVVDNGILVKDNDFNTKGSIKNEGDNSKTNDLIISKMDNKLDRLNATIETTTLSDKTTLPDSLISKNNILLIKSKGESVRIIQQTKNGKSNITSDFSSDFRKKTPIDSIIKLKSGTIFMFDNLNFKKGKAILTLHSLEILNMLARSFKEYPQLKISISGHTDNVGSPTANLLLSKKRASTVRNYLINKGLKLDQIKTYGYGQTKPISTNKTEVGRAENRRVEFKIIDF